MRRVAALALLAAGCAAPAADDVTAVDGPLAAVLVRPDDPGAGLQFDLSLIHI